MIWSLFGQFPGSEGSSAPAEGEIDESEGGSKRGSKKGLPGKGRALLPRLRSRGKTADVEPFADWWPGVPVELAMSRPREEFPLLYRHAKLLGKHPVRISLLVVPEFSKADRSAKKIHRRVIEQPPRPALDVTISYSKGARK